jgi:TatD DNase family protein
VEADAKLIDVHTHLEQYASKELEAVLNHAQDADVGWIVTSGMDLETSTCAFEIACKHEQILASVGIHPWSAADVRSSDLDRDLDELRTLSHNKEVVAIGEIGLDFIDNVFTGVTYHDNRRLQEAQEQAFRKLVELACESKLPVIIHARGAYPAIISILKEQKAQVVGGVIHNFDGDEKQADELLDMGFYLSFGGAITYPEANTLHETCRKIPLTGILTETDSPYMPLYQQCTEKNEPANVVQVVKVIAELKKTEQERLKEIIHSNFRALFTLPQVEERIP